MVTMATTSGRRIGLGHLRRCVTLARELAPAADVTFMLTGDETGLAYAKDAGFPAHAMSDALDVADVLVVDDYAYSADALRDMRAKAASFAVIDDLADRAFDADLVLNASPAASTLSYALSDACVRLFGPSYALLGDAFRSLPKRVTTDVTRVLVTLGGSDPHGQTPAVVAAVRQALPTASIDVVIGPLFPATTLPVGCIAHRSPSSLQPLMTSAQLAVTGGGQTTYELAACGLPAIALCIAENQRGNLTELARAGSLVVSDLRSLIDDVRRVAHDRDLRDRMSVAGQTLVDGNGARRAATALLSLQPKVRAHA